MKKFMPTIMTDGEFVESAVNLQRFSGEPVLTLKHRMTNFQDVQVELDGKTLVNARALIYAVLALVPDALEKPEPK